MKGFTWRRAVQGNSEQSQPKAFPGGLDPDNATSPAKGDNPATASVSVLGLNPDVHVFWLEASEGALHNFRRQRPDGATEPKEEPTRTK